MCMILQERVRKVIEKTGGIVEERIYLGGYEIFRKSVSGVLDFERETLHISDDTKKIASIETKSIENGSPISSPVSNIRYQYDNHLGSASLELDDTAAIISYEEYHPFGTTSYRSGRTETEVSLKRYKYVGKEQDDETGLYYYGARYYAAWICRFVSVDPLADDFQSVNPYNYVLNMPIIAVDPDGKKVVLASKKEAKAISIDLNKIYKSKYKKDGAFSVKERIRSSKVRTNDWSLTDPSTWSNIFSEPEYKTVEKRDYEIVTNDSFDFNTDKYTKALSEVINSKIEIKVDIISDSKRGGKEGFLKGYGGGYITSPTSFILSDKLSSYGDKGTTGKFPSKWTLGGVFLHEALYHLHEQGQTESKAITNDGSSGPNIMRKHYSSKTGNNHPAGNNVSIKND